MAEWAQRWLRAAANLKRKVQGTDAKLAAEYLRAASEPKLHIGGGPRCLEGWLNSDLNRATGVIGLDATRMFPFKSDTFAFIFSEHMIEHVGYDEGGAMLRECLRVLAPGGTIRLVTPDLHAIMALAGQPRSPAQRAYFDYFSGEHIPKTHPQTLASVANAMFRSWGHTFIYDEETLRHALETAGFVDITRHRLGESTHRELQGLEHEVRYPPGQLDFESLALEAHKPVAGNEAKVTRQ